VKTKPAAKKPAKKAAKPADKPVKKPVKKVGKCAGSKPGTSKKAAEDKRKAFVEAYLSNGGNLTEAARTVGYSEGGASKAGHRMSKDVRFLSILRERAGDISKKFELTTEKTLREIARLSYSDPRKFYNSDGSLKPIHELDDDTAACIASIEVDEIMMEHTVIGHTKKIKQWDKNSALEKAMKFHGLYEKDNAQQQPVEIVIKF